MTLAATGAPKPDVAAVASKAGAWLREAKGDPAEIAALARLTAN